MVGKQQLIARAWPQTFVEESNLKIQVSALRRALADGQGGNRYGANLPHKEGRLTEIWLAVLEILSETNQPLGAYELLARLQSCLGKTFRAPTIYRALEFIGDLGLVDRIESRNAFVLARDLERPHSSVIFLCNRCNASFAVEAPGVAALDCGKRRDFGLSSDEADHRMPWHVRGLRAGTRTDAPHDKV